MDSANLVCLLSLAAIWGGSFLFMRIGAPVLGAVWLVEWRVGLATLFLAGVGWYTLAGSLVVIAGTALVTGFSPRRLFSAKADQNV